MLERKEGERERDRIRGMPFGGSPREEAREREESSLEDKERGHAIDRERGRQCEWETVPGEFERRGKREKERAHRGDTRE